MPLTPLHLAFAWPLKLRFRQLSLAGLTYGTIAPDIETAILYILGIEPSRTFAHSIWGAFTEDLAISTLLALAVSRIMTASYLGFSSKPKFDFKFASSSIAASLLHEGVDFLHHEHNPVIWPLQPAFVAGPWHSVEAQILINIIAAFIFAFLLRYLLKRSGEGLGLIFRNPAKALRVMIEALERPER